MYGKIKEHLQQELAEIKAAGLYKSERVITSPQRAEIEVAGRKVLNFCARNKCETEGVSERLFRKIFRESRSFLLFV